MQQPDSLNAPQGPRFPWMTKGGSMFARGLAAVDVWLLRYGIWILLLLAILYYGQYYRSGLNLGGEGGTNGVIALRLMEGQRPIVDTFLGYNVMWFYPIVWLFKIFGANYIALRIYFFVLCALGGIWGFLILRHATRSGIYSILLAALIVLIPGMLFRNYMPFLGMLNMLMLLEAYVFSQKTTIHRLIWMAGAGVVLGLTFLIRVDLGTFFAFLTAGLIILFPFGHGAIQARLPMALAGVILAPVMVGLTHLPVYLDARARGFDKNFLNQYSDWPNYLRGELRRKMNPKPVAPKAAPAIIPQGQEVPKEPAEKYILQRIPLSEIGRFPRFYDKAFVLITYLPIVLSLAVFLFAGSIFLWSWVRDKSDFYESSLTVLTALGCALTLFPQFFFFRPDTPHLSEFMVPFLIALGCAGWLAWRIIRTSPVLIFRMGAFVVGILCLTNASLYAYQSFPKESAGTIAAIHKRRVEFKAENGVDVLLKKTEREDYKSIYDLIMKYSRPDDYLICYPYAPTLNFMTNRRSYEKNLYVDNATADRKFYEYTLAEIEKFRPAVIVIDNRDINKSDASRFAVWAAPTYAFICENYKLAGKFHRQEVYVRPDRFNPAQP